jgi:ribosomal protein S18 acetylase RimI-like enzyme
MGAAHAEPVMQPPFRRATVEDMGALAQFVEFASEGLALHLWSKLAGPDRDPWGIGRERVGSETGGISYRNAVITEVAGRSAAGLISYPLPDRTEPISSTLPALLVPLQELMNLAPGTWYVHVLAAYPQYRGKGLGFAFLGLADRLATAAGKQALSLVVSDTNTGARRLYESCGYQQAGQRSMVKEDWQHPGANWVLLRKDL